MPKQNEIIRRYYTAMNKIAKEDGGENELYKIELLMKQAKITPQLTAR